MIREPYQYVQTSICLPINAALFFEFPEVVVWQEEEALLKKCEFHVTICKGEDIFTAARIERPVGEKKLLELFNGFVANHPIQLLSFLNDFRFARDDARSRKTIIVRCRVSNLDTFFAELERAFGTTMPLQPTHVTLYTLRKNIGIHIPSSEAMERLEQVHVPALDEALKCVRI